MSSPTELPSLLLFGPQAEHPSLQVLDQLKQTIRTNQALSPLKDAAVDLPRFWETLTRFDPTLIKISAERTLESLSRWLDGGTEPPPHNAIGDEPNHYALPLTILLQCTQYSRYLSHIGGNAHDAVLHSVQRAGGVHGFCAGFLTAIAVASSETVAEFGIAAAAALRLALCIGAYVDLDGAEYSCVAVRQRDNKPGDRQELDRIVELFAGAYVSSINDASSVSVTLKTSDLETFNKVILGQGWRAKHVHVRGRFHNQCHSSAAERINKFVQCSPDMQHLTCRKLHVPHVLASTLLKTADWFGTVNSAFLRLPRSNRTVAFVGQGQHIPASLLSDYDVKIVNLDTFPRSASGAQHPSERPESSYPPHSIAIVGMSGRFPGADSVDELWDLLTEGKIMVEPAPVDKFKLPQTGEFADTKWWGNFLKDREAFDHKFFKKTSREAAAWDPQQRILLEVIYESLESAGYFRPSSTRQPNDYGCYIGAVLSNYYDNISCHPSSAFATIGTTRGFLSGCMSHYFGWTGPSLTIDTLCSSSLVAINTACRAIWSGECSRAVAGGANVICSPFDYRNLASAGFLSPTGQCKPFDAAADGYCRGEAVGVVVLKRLSDAMKENDNILGVIVGSAANQNHHDSHITVPHAGSQVSLYQEVMRLGNVEPRSVSYVEAHGTGTGVGDPVEVHGIRDAFGGPQRDSILHFGSIKGSIGHTESTAGVAGLIKVLLQMRHGKIPAQTSYRTLNPKIPALNEHQMAIPTKLLPWEPSETRIACVNSFGAAGSNSAVLIREGPTSVRPETPLPASRYPLLISAASSNSLSAYCQKLLSWLKDGTNATDDIASVAYNLSDRANHALSHTLAATVGSINHLKSWLEAAASSPDITKAPNSVNPVILVFGGQESTAIGLSKEVYESSTVFRRHLDSCDKLLVSNGMGSLYPTIFQQQPIQDPVTLHPALFAVQYAAAQAWIECGLKVDAVVGHSFGQLTAFCVSGVLSLEDGLKLVTGRAALMVKHWGTEAGSMMCVRADRQTVQQALQKLNAQDQKHYVEIACHNGPQNYVVVGSSKSVDALEDMVRGSLRTKRLQVTNGFHSEFTEGLLPHLDELAQELTWRSPAVHIELCDESEAQPEPSSSAVSRHTRNPVFFHNAIARLEERFPQATWLEAGRGSSVMGLVKGCVANLKSHFILSPQLTSAEGSLADITVDLWKAGHPVQYWSFHRSQKPQYKHMYLPPYQFEKTRHWLGFTSWGGVADEKTPAARPEKHELFTHIGFKDNSQTQALFRIDPQADRFQALSNGHVMAGQALAPASLYYEVVSRASLFLAKDVEAKVYVPTVENLVMKSPIGQDINTEITLTLNRIELVGNPSWSFSITTQSAEGRKTAPFEVSTGSVCLQKRKDAGAAKHFNRYGTLVGPRRYEQLMNHPEAEKMAGRHIYRAFSTVVQYGESFHGIKEVACVGGEAAGKVIITPDVRGPVDQRLCDSPMTDSFMQFAGLLVCYFNNPSVEDVYVCGRIEHVEMGGDFDPDAGEWIVYATMSEPGIHGTATADAYILESASKRLVMAVFGCTFTKVSRAVLERMLKTANNGASTSGVSVSRKPALSSTSRATPLTISVPPTKRPVLVSKPSKRQELFQVISNVTDVLVDELKDDTTLEDLGIDSLLATEVLNDVRNKLGLTLDLNSFLFFPDLKALAAHVDEQLGLGGCATDDDESGYESMHPAVPVKQKISRVANKASKRQELFQVFSAVTDIPVEDITDDMTLDDLGIDSLMATEILNDVRTGFNLTIDFATFLFLPNLKAIAAHVDEQLGLGAREDADAPVSPSTDSGTFDMTTLKKTQTTLLPRVQQQVLEHPTVTSVLDTFPAQNPSTSKKSMAATIETLVYKKIRDQDIHADVYYPVDKDLGGQKMPIALMIHGGSHILFSRKDIRPAQTRYLLEQGFLPISLDHRLCPETTLSEGPMVDICDALDWARNILPALTLKRSDLRPDGERVVAIGWSSGGQLAMSLGYTAPPRGLRPPEAVLAFYCPSDYEDEWWRSPIQPVGAEDKGYEYDVLEAIQEKPITNYGIIGAWEALSDPRLLADPRSRIVLHINWKAQTLPVIIGGLISKSQRESGNNATVKDWNDLPQPSTDKIRAVSSRHQIREGNYRVPTFMIHGTADDLIPWQQTRDTYNVLISKRVPAGLALVKDAPHICDLSVDTSSEGWKATMKGYNFIKAYV